MCESHQKQYWRSASGESIRVIFFPDTWCILTVEQVCTMSTLVFKIFQQDVVTVQNIGPNHRIGFSHIPWVFAHSQAKSHVDNAKVEEMLRA